MHPGASLLLTALLGLPDVLAHGGRFTWDEALMVAAPIAVFAAVLVTANRRATALQARRDAELGVEGDPTDADATPSTPDAPR